MDKIGVVTGTSSSRIYHSAQKNKQKNFQQILDSKKNDQFKISKHAEARLQSRNVELNSNDYHEISAAIDDLADKGSRESLLIYKDIGLIANIHNRVIVTAMKMSDMNTITNIDSTKFIK